MTHDIRKIRSLEEWIGYFSETLCWNIDVDDFDDIEDITYNFTADDIGLKEEAFAKISSLRQLQPMVDGQPWGIFCVEFDSNRFEVSALRKILSGLIPRRRNSTDHAVWNQHDLLFICNWGEDNNRTIGMAHFEEKEGVLPQIKMISCAPALEDFTQIKVFEDHISKLTWPKNAYDMDAWRREWSSAFTSVYKQVIHDSSTLTIRLAAEAQSIRNRILDILNVESKNGYVHLLYEKFKYTLIHDMTEQQFADMYAQTIVYGLFSARCMDRTQDDFSAAEAVDCIPNTNPFLQSLMRECLGSENKTKLSFDELEISNVVDILVQTNTEAIIKDFNRQTGGGREDPVIHFYEEFLTAYDKAQKVQRGVYYTPQPVVNFIVRAVDTILKDEFNLKDGLASTETKKIKVQRESVRRVNGAYTMVDELVDVPAVQVLDPATGTGTFLRQVILQIYDNFKQQHKDESDAVIAAKWNKYVPDHLLPRLNGFELMMAPYAVAHMKLAMVLKDTGYDFSGEGRLQVYLTNSLEEPGNSSAQLTWFDDPLATESIAANGVKKNTGINIILGNPPYAGESSNKGQWILSLMEDYKFEPGTQFKLQEANSRFVNDDYIKFIRYAQYMLQTDGDCILCFINPHGYIDSPTFRGVRYNLLQRFQDIFVLDLHGNSKKKEKASDGSKDENVFDIQQGVCINLFIKKKGSRQKCRVHQADLYGLRDEKYNHLSNSVLSDIQWNDIQLIEPNYIFNYHKNVIEDVYNKGFSVRDLFLLGTLGVLSKRDSLVVAFYQDELRAKIEDFSDLSRPASEVCNNYGIPEKDNDNWDAQRVRSTINAIVDKDKYIIPIHYRPFDIRYIFYQSDIIARPNTKVLQHLQGYENLALILCRQGGASNLEQWDCAFIVNCICDQNIFRRGGGTVMPLYCYTNNWETADKETNINKQVLREIELSLGKKLNSDFSPEELLGYIYAVLYSDKYRKQYQKYMSKEFPRVPYPVDFRYFKAMSMLGLQLIKVQTDFCIINNYSNVYFEVSGSNTVEKTVFKDEMIYINKTQYFIKVSGDVFNYTIGGNSPLQKWLKDRKGTTLRVEDIIAFKKMIITIQMTLNLIADVDDLIVMP